MNEFLKKLNDPAAEYRPHPFWSWNGKLEEDELKWQIGELKRTGHGGFFMHARDGLKTEYMSDEWFRLIRAATDEAERIGLEAWCYDEDGWPSGSCGGKIPRDSEERRVRWLRLKKFDGKTEGDLLRFFAVSADGSYRVLEGDAESIKPVSLSDGEELMYAATFTSNDYIDILNSDTVAEFIRTTHDEYDRKVGDCFCDGRLCGFFTDEPQYALCRNPWSSVIEDEFYREYGYSITDNIPALLIGRDGHEGIRFDFWRLISRLYTDSFAKQVYNWCNEHDCRLTGHTMMEDNLLCQIHCTAGAMPMYEYMHIPGVDWLGKYPASVEECDNAFNPTIPLQVGTVASQLGHDKVLTETFAMAGSDISMAEMLYLIEWQMLYGVSLVCQHLYPYTIRGRRKYDFPPALSHNAPWWEVYRVFNDTVSRLGMIISEGIDDPGVLMLHPMHSVWLKYTNDNMNAEGEFDKSFARAEVFLDSQHIPFHLGDETLMARHGKVEDGKLIIGKRSYHTVFIPPIWGLDRSTYELLSEFSAAGGRIALIGDSPEFIDGRPAKDELDGLFASCPHLDFERRKLVQYIDESGIREVSIKGRLGEDEKLRHCRRELPGGITAYLILNTDRNNAKRVCVTLPAERAVELSCDTMTYRGVASRKASDGMLSIDLEFAPMEAHLILTGEDLPEPSCDISNEYISVDLRGTSRSWRISSDSAPNCFMIDNCRVDTNDGITDLRHISRSDRFVTPDTGVIYSFTVSDDTDLSPLADMRLVSEFDDDVEVTVNGNRVTALPEVWWLDRSFSVYEIGGFVKTGKNDIVFRKVNREYEIGYVYLTGAFGVYATGGFALEGDGAEVSRGELVISNRPDELHGGSIVSQGYPFFAGRLSIECNITADDISVPRRAVLGRVNASCARITVNGVPGEVLAYGSLEEDITSRLVEGTNTIKVELWIGNRNLLGAHHTLSNDSGPGDFYPFDNPYWIEDYIFKKEGIGE